MSFEEFQDGVHGGHLGYRDGTILPSSFSSIGLWEEMSFEELAILNLHVATMLPTKFQLNPTYGSGGDVENMKS